MRGEGTGRVKVPRAVQDELNSPRRESSGIAFIIPWATEREYNV